MFHRPKTEEQETEPNREFEDKTKRTVSDIGIPASSADVADIVEERAEGIVSNSQNDEKKLEERKMNNSEDQEKQNRSVEVPSAASAYQVPQTAAPRIPAGIPATGAYPGASYGASEHKGNEGRKLLIGAGITMSGEIESCDILVVEGSVEAALKGAKSLQIAESGVFYGTVEIEEAVISGRFEGDIVVTGRLTLTATGSVTGSIAYGALAIEAGATIDGKISPLAAAMAGSGAVESKVRMPVPAKNDNQGAVNELPFAGSAAAVAAE